MPAPTGPLRVRLAAVVTNLSWGPGAIVMSTADYRRGWNTDAATALDLGTGDPVVVVIKSTEVMVAKDASTGDAAP